MFEKDAVEIAKLRFNILNAMMDDSEDIEQVYLAANESRFETGTQPQFPLREIIDEMKLMLEEGFIKPDFSNDEKLAPLGAVSLSEFHHSFRVSSLLVRAHPKGQGSLGSRS